MRSISVAWSPDGKRLATGSRDDTAKVWDAETGKELLTLSGHEDSVTSVAWSPDGKRLATGSWDDTAKVWDAETGKELLTLNGHRDAVSSVAWSPDGKRLATGSEDNTAKVWDAATGRELLTLKGHRVRFTAWPGARMGSGWRRGVGTTPPRCGRRRQGRNCSPSRATRGVSSVAWSPDGKRLATAGDDGIVQVYAMDVDLLMSLARSRVTRNLTLEECRKYLHLDEVPPVPFPRPQR